MISVFERNGSRIKRFRKPERSDINMAVLTWFKQGRRDSVVLVNGPVRVITSVLPEF